MKIHFNYNGMTINVPITDEQLHEDANEINDFWGNFEFCSYNYQIQNYQSTKEIAIYHDGGSTPIAYTKYEFIKTMRQ